jgi:hypothetical protein
MSLKKLNCSAKDTRDSHAQQKYREDSQSQHKESKEAAHTVSHSISATVREHYRGPGRVPNDESKIVKEVMNDDGNMRMVSRDTNRREHVHLDKQIVEKRETGEPLTPKEEDRARLQTGYIQKRQDDLPKSTYNAYKNLYAELETSSGKKVWDGRKDKK